MMTKSTGRLCTSDMSVFVDDGYLSCEVSYTFLEGYGQFWSDYYEPPMIEIVGIYHLGNDISAKVDKEIYNEIEETLLECALNKGSQT